MSQILVIDDDEGLRRVLGQILVRAGYAVAEAADGRQGLKAFRKAPVDLVICDLIMPDQEGLETISVLRKEFPTLKIIAISGGARVTGYDFLPAATGLGANMAISKPFSREQILESVEKLIGKASPGAPAPVSA